MIVAAGLLALASVPEAFVVLWARQAGMEVVWIPLVWAAASLAKMGIAMPAGILSDRLGRMPLLLTGWSARVAVLLLLAFLRPDGAWVWVLFVSYAAALAITEPAERSLIGDHARTTRARHGVRPVSPRERPARAAGRGAVRRAVGAFRLRDGVRDGRRGHRPGRRADAEWFQGASGD